MGNVLQLVKKSDLYSRLQKYNLANKTKLITNIEN